MRSIVQRLLCSYVAIVLMGTGLFVGQVAHAQVLTQDLGLNALATKDQVEKQVNKPLSVAIIQILVNLISFVANRLAYDAAMAIASGGPGQTPNYEYRDTTQYGQDLFNDVLGESIASLSDGLDAVGIQFDVCAPSDPIKRLNLQLGIAEGATTKSTQRPRCDWRDIQSNWEGYLARLEESSDPQQVYKDLAGMFNQGQSELGANLTILAQTYTQASGEKATGVNELLANDRFKDVSNIITGNVETPAAVLESQFNEKLKEQGAKETDALQNALFSNEGALLQIGISAGSVFLNTLLSQLTNKIYNGLFQPPTTAGVFNPDFISVNGRDQARETYKSLLSAPIQTLDQYSVVNEFVTCQGGANRGLNNCVIDTSFAAAIARAEAGKPLTVQEAIDEGLLHGDWPLISDKNAARNQDPYCYTSAYCHGNLAKLRIARILPIGWELAAEKSGQDGNPIVTLQEVIDRFNDCNTEASDLVDINHPYCHLVDPNWVLKYPETQCRAQVYGQMLLSQNSDQRAQVCVDTPSCIQEDENGNCIGGYGYCTRERNVWRFDGDACPAQYASCTTLTSRTGTVTSYLTTTVDTAGCTADNAGCTAYAEQRHLDNNVDADPGDDAYLFATGFCTNAADFGDACVTNEDCGSGACVAFDDPALPTALQGETATSLYLNAQAQSCDPSQNGCRQLVRAAGATLNTLPNPSFEADTDADGQPDGWVLGAGAQYNTTGSLSLYGTDAIVLSQSASGVDSQHGLYLAPRQFYTVSAYVKRTGSSLAQVRLNTLFQTGDGTTVGLVANDPRMPVPTVAANNCVANGFYLQKTASVEDVYERIACSFSTRDTALWMFMNVGSSSGQFALDGVQLDARETTLPFAVGYSAEDRVALKVAPAYLGCTGSATDPAACSQFAKVCAPTEVGCTAYTPNNGNPTVPGIVNATNYCPAECVGYDSYRQLATNFSQSVFPVTFIPSTAQQCSAREAGCSEFTNLDALNEGGEARAYFSDVRVCQEVAEANGTNAPQATFYTWEGSDEEGFQIRTWTLKNSQISAAPCTSFDPVSGNCTDSTSSSPAGCTSHADVIANPDCREFYDTRGTIHYRYFSDTITVDDACSPYRKTVSTQTDCQNSNGVWNAASGNCTYNIMPSESQSCSARANGCRGYLGNTGNNTRLVISETFEGGALTGWALNHTGAPYSPAPIYSNESVATSGHSAELQNTGSLARMLDASTIGEVHDGATYLVHFWAKGNGRLRIGFEDADGDGANFTTDAITLSAGWQEYTFGPFDPSAVEPDLDAATTGLLFTNVAAGTSVFVDNVILREVQDTVYLIENSWNTPSTCDQTPQGAAAPQYALGCEAYTDQNGATANLRSFASICRQEVVGCEAFYDTQNSTSLQAQAFNLTCTLGAVATSPTLCAFAGEDVCTVAPREQTCLFNYDGISQPSVLASVTGPESRIVERDTTRYLVDAPQYRCSSEAAGCTELGLPEYNAAKTAVTAFTSVFKLDRPDTYSRILCGASDLFCEAFTSTDGRQLYFKNPGDKTCEYKTGVSIEGTEYSGWFRSGTQEPCYYNDANNNGFDTADLASAYLIGGVQAGIWLNGDTQTADVTSYDGWVGTCPAQQNSCSAFVDPADEADTVYPDGRPYYFLNNDKVNQSDAPANEKCEGLVSLERGCAAFNNTSIAALTFNASATYVSSWHADELLSRPVFSSVPPIDCRTPEGGAFDTDGDGTADVDLCQRFCVYPQVTGFGLSGAVYGLSYGGSCLTDQDCGTRADLYGNDQAGGCFVPLSSSGAVGVCAGGDNSGTTCSSSASCGGGTCLNVTADALAAAYGADYRQNNDSNTILNVRRDRSCSEWLACDSQTTTFDPSTGQVRNICESVSLCNEFSASTGDTTFCSGWADAPQQILTEDVYAARDVTWYGSEYAGYSIPDQYGIEQYTQVNVNPLRWCENSSGAILSLANAGLTTYNEATGLWSNGTPIACTTDSECPTDGSCEEADADYRLAVDLGPCAPGVDNGYLCQVGACSDSGLACAVNSNCSPGATCVLGASARTGQCYNDRCVSSIAGGTITTNALQECRGYPEANAPFPNEIVTRWRNPSDEPTYPGDATDYYANPWQLRATSFKPGFSNVQYCANGQQCECSYTRAEYGSGSSNLNMGLRSSDAPIGVCEGGPYAGIECTDDDACHGTGTSSGTCQFKTVENDYIGWTGYCLERDGSISILGNQNKHACLLWLPVDRLEGGTDLYGKFTTAGYPATNSAYCTQTKLYADVYPTGSSLSQGNPNTIVPACAASPATSPMPAPLAQSIAANTTSVFPFPFNLILSAVTAGTGAPVGYSTPNDTDPVISGGACNFNEWESCWANVACPKDHFAIIGSCGDNDDPSTANDQCRTSGFDGCPFFCVPLGAVATQDTDGFFAEGQSCDPTGYTPGEGEDGVAVSSIPGGSRFVVPITSYFDPSNDSVTDDHPFGRNSQFFSLSSLTGDFDDVGYVPPPGSEQQFGFLVPDIDDYLDGYKSCVRKGVEAEVSSFSPDSNSRDLYLPLFPYVAQGQYGFSDYGAGFEGNGNYAQFYLGCSELALTSVEAGYGASNAEVGNAAFTNRTLSPGEAYALTLEATQDDPAKNPGYTTGTVPSPVGRAAVSLETYTDTNNQLVRLNTDDMQPVNIDMCASGTNLKVLFDGAGACTSNALTAEARGYQAYSVDYPQGNNPQGGATEVLFWHRNTADSSTGLYLLKQFFARVYSVWDYSPTAGDGTGAYQKQTSGANTYDIRTEGDLFGTEPNDGNPGAPQIASVIAPCVGDNCTEGTVGTFSVNGSDGGSFTSQDSFVARVEFFAWTDPNQYPLRKVLVDWGDGQETSWAASDVPNAAANAWGRGSLSGSTANDNYYKAARGLNLAGQAICTPSADEREWGKTSESCQESPYTFQHHYRCTPALFAWLEQNDRSCDYTNNGELVNSPCTNGVQCVFQPRVYVLDNWDYCTGRCTLQPSTGEECFDSRSERECDYTLYPAAEGVGGDYDNPWINWAGTIRVTP